MQRNKIILCFFLMFLVIPGVLIAKAGDEVPSVEGRAEIDTAIKETWTGMRQALANNDLEKALTFISVNSRGHYRELFTAFGDRLPEAARELRDIGPVYIKGDSAEYRMKRPEQYGGKMVTLDYNVYFVVDYGGMWKIDWF